MSAVTRADLLSRKHYATRVRFTEDESSMTKLVLNVPTRQKNKFLSSKIENKDIYIYFFSLRQASSYKLSFRLSLQEVTMLPLSD
jgi:hypothetical protein